MSEPSYSPAPYRVAYSEYVRQELRSLIARARGRGLGRQVLAAVKAVDERLRIYPQFGDPLRDLKLESARLCIGCVPPLVVRYWLDEERRTVIVVAPFLPLSRSGLLP